MWTTAPLTKIICDGKIFAGNPRDYPVVFIMWFVYLLLSALLLGTINEYVKEEFSYALGIIGYFLGIPGFYSAVKCFMADPGIIQRGNIEDPGVAQARAEGRNIQSEDIEPAFQPKAEHDEGIINPTDTRHEDKVNFSENNQVRSDFEENGKDVELQSAEQQIVDVKNINVRQQKQVNNLLIERYCSTCKIMRPPLASHCGQCNNCVKNFDHHCVFMGNCIGERNQKWFLWFLISTGMWSCYGLIFAAINVIQVIEEDEVILSDIYNCDSLFYPLATSLVLVFLAFVWKCHQTIKGWTFLFALIMIVVTTVNSMVSNYHLKLIDNPVTAILLVAAFGGTLIFVSPFMCFNISLACNGSTQKQDHFLIVTNQHKTRDGPSIGNFCQLLFRKTIPSEILK